MKTNELVDQLAAEIEELVRQRAEFAHVSCVELVVGNKWITDAAELEDAFEDFFDSHSNPLLQGAFVEVTIVSPGDTFSAPGRDDTQTANGFELLIVNLRGK